MKKWKYDDIYSYGILIPAISIYMIWLKRNDLRKIQTRPDTRIGFAIVFIALSIFALGYIGSVIIIQELSLLVMITGFIFLLFGRQVFRMIWFPIFYLMFMIPIWDSVLDPLHYPFQYLSASLGVRILQIIGIPVYQEDIFIELPNINLVVASVCSGVHYLISVVAIGIPLSYYYLSSFKKRFLLIMLSVVIAIFSNSLRVSAIGFFAYQLGPNVSQDIHGPFDMLRSMMISITGFVVLFVGTFLLQDKETENVPITKAAIVPKNPEKVSEISGSHMKRNNVLAIILSIMMVFVVGTFVNFYQHKPVSPKNNFSSFPDRIGDWERVEAESFHPAENFNEFGVDQEVMRKYRDSFGDVITLHIGYWDFQVQGKELSNYKIAEILDNSRKYKLPRNTFFIYDENKYARKNRGEDDICIYWIDVNGRIIGDRYSAKAYNILDFVTHGRTNSAIVLIKINKKNGEDLDQTIGRYDNFIFELSALMKHYLPEI